MPENFIISFLPLCSHTGKSLNTPLGKGGEYYTFLTVLWGEFASLYIDFGYSGYIFVHCTWNSLLILSKL
jgi:hypothetical protein